MKYALDTNTLIYYFKGMGSVADRLLAQAPSDICIPTVVLYELETGIAKSNAPQKRRAQLQAVLDVVQVLPFDEPSAHTTAQLRATLEQQGQMIGLLDILIAGTALTAGCTLVTRNLKEFQRVPGLLVENWY